MPELPEVETTRRGISPILKGNIIKSLVVRNGRLRWPIAEQLPSLVSGQEILDVFRRAKYLLIKVKAGHLIVHLGMSGSLRFVGKDVQAGKHDHFDLEIGANIETEILRYHDPRRFGALLWTDQDPCKHPLLRSLGPEPLEDIFNDSYLHDKCQRTGRPIKLAIMDAAIVVGVGNIYANESLFLAGILPSRPANSLKAHDSARLCAAIKVILIKAIEAGGSTLRDYHSSTGDSGYFQLEYKVYGRSSQKCANCGAEIRRSVIGQRATFWCPICQQ